jgi:zinc-binding alcohol dehydrogenase family protein
MTYEALPWHPAERRFTPVTPPTAEPVGHDLLVAVQAVSVNPVDLKLRAMMAAGDPPRVLGFDAVGTVVACGPDAAGFAPGDRVFYAGAAHRPGTNAARHLVDARIVARAPGNWSDADAAALPLTALTAWEALFERLRLAPLAAAQPERLLVINGAGGVGSVALQLAHLSGIQATATATRPESQGWCRRMGAAQVIGHEALNDLPDMRFDRILCCHDTDRYFDIMARLVAPGGLICALAGAKQPHNLMPLFNKSAGFIWEYMFTRPLHTPPDMARQGWILGQIAALADAGRLRPTRTLTLQGLAPETLAKAHDLLSEGRQIGKIVITA